MTEGGEMTIEPLAECPPHLDELPEFDPADQCSCADCGYVLDFYSHGDPYEGPNGKTYPVSKNMDGFVGEYGWVKLWTDVHFCFVCNAEIEIEEST